MRRRHIVAVGMLVMLWPAASMAARPTTAPAERSGEARANRDLAEQTAKLDAEYRSKKAELLRRYVNQLTEEKRAAIRARKKADAQRLFEAIADANAKIDQYVPPPDLDAKPAASFFLKINDYDGAGGFGRVVNVSPTDISVTLENDYGRPSKVVWEAKLTPPQCDRLAKFLKNFPLDQLQDHYINPDVFDGYQVFFTIQRGTDPPRKISVCNRRQPSLERLIDEVNEVLPPKFLLSRMGK